MTALCSAPQGAPSPPMKGPPLAMSTPSSSPRPRPCLPSLPSCPSRPSIRSMRAMQVLVLLTTLLAASIPSAGAVFINFENCLSPAYRNAADPPRLQFTPMHLWAAFNTTAPSHQLSVKVYGNVSGQAVNGSYPPPDSPSWHDDDNQLGKIVDYVPGVPGVPGSKRTTFFADFKTLSYSAWHSDPQEFCQYTFENSTCPIAPAFPQDGANASDPYTLRGFHVERDFYSTYSFATWQGTLRIVAGDNNATVLGCVSTTITPDLGHALVEALCWLPAAILILVAIATVFAATCCPWGSTNIFRWTSNYGRDEDLLRLVTPGFGDCLQYIQFIVLAGSLNLNYPGYYQPVVRQASWSLLLFNQSLVSKAAGSQSLVDGIYFANGTYGISRLAQYVGLAEERDIWACMAVWLLGVIGIVTMIAQLGFLGRWAYRTLTREQDTDLQEKNWPFTIGNVVRIVFNYFLLPIISISLFQMVVAAHSPGSVVGTAVVLLIGVTGVAVWIFWFIFTTRPRAHLFDDLPTLLTYGPLYNTYSDDAAPFAFIPVLLTTMRGIAIGAIQPSGIAQIIILAICEVILMLTLNAFRPFQSNTSMNAYHTFFSAVRLTSTLLMVAFVPTLGVSEASKGWIGYVILLLHAIVLVFGFFMNSLQTIIEVAARRTGAGADRRGGLTTVFGKRQLQQRNHRHQRSSLNSNAAMLGPDADKQSVQQAGSRGRSMSGSSAILLSQGYGSQRASIGFDQFSQGGDLSHGGTSPGTPATSHPPHYVLGGSAPSSRRQTMGTTFEAADPYYRPPRPRKHTLDSLSAGKSGRRSGGSQDLTNVPYADNDDLAEAGLDAGEGPSTTSPGRTVTPAFLRLQGDDSDPHLERRKHTDYSVRESDYYYGVQALRGPLSDQPTRKLKTGPADPMGPVSSATGWLRSLKLFAGGKKEKSKGFEVVRSTRMPPQMMIAEEDEISPPMPQEPYQDSPGTPPRHKDVQDESPEVGVIARGGRLRSGSESDSADDEPLRPGRPHRASSVVPTLAPIDTGGDIELPSRVGSHSSRLSRGPSAHNPPSLPRRSSKRNPSTDKAVLNSTSRLSTVLGSPSATPAPPFVPAASGPPAGSGPAQERPLRHGSRGPSMRLPFGAVERSSGSPERTHTRSTTSSLYADGQSDYNRLDDLHPGYGLDAMGQAPHHGLRHPGQLAPPVAISGSERPLSTGFVHHRTAGESVHSDIGLAGGGPRHEHLEARAEIVDRSRSVSTRGSEA